METLRWVGYCFLQILWSFLCMNTISCSETATETFIISSLSSPSCCDTDRSLMGVCASCVLGTSTRSHWQKGKGFTKLWTILQPNRWEHTGALRVSNKGFTRWPRSTGMYMWRWTTPVRPSSRTTTRLRDTGLSYSKLSQNPNLRNSQTLKHLDCLY